jgi:hypothetical protein
MKNLRLKFADCKNYRFSLMCTDLNSLIQKEFPGKIFFVKAEKECLSRFSGSFFGPSNRISGWLIDESEEEIFQNLFDSGYIDSAWDDYEISIWSYFDGEYSGKWLFSFRAPSIGEVIL